MPVPLVLHPLHMSRPCCVWYHSAFGAPNYNPAGGHAPAHLLSLLRFETLQGTTLHPALLCAGSKQVADGSQPAMGGYASVGGSDRDLHGLSVQVIAPAPLMNQTGSRTATS